MGTRTVPSRTAQETPHRWCLDCGYALKGLAEYRCPECGREFDPEDPQTISGRSTPAWARRMLGTFGPLAGAVVFVPSAGLLWMALFPSFYYMMLGWALVILAYVLFFLVVSALHVFRQHLAVYYRRRQPVELVRPGWRLTINVWLLAAPFLVYTQAPIRLTFWIFRPQFDALVRETMATTPPGGSVQLATSRWIGPYHIAGSMNWTIDGGYMFDVLNDRESGFAYVPGGTPEGYYNAGDDGPLGGPWHWFTCD